MLRLLLLFQSSLYFGRRILIWITNVFKLSVTRLIMCTRVDLIDVIRNRNLNNIASSSDQNYPILYTQSHELALFGGREPFTGRRYTGGIVSAPVDAVIFSGHYDYFSSRLLLFYPKPSEYVGCPNHFIPRPLSMLLTPVPYFKAANSQ